MHPRPWRVLIVEDDAFFARVLADALKPDARFMVTGVAATLGAAVAMIETSPPDVLLLDHGLPDAWGAPAAGALRRLAGTEMRIVVVSGNTAAADFAELGVDRWVEKRDVRGLPAVLTGVLVAPTT